jgi:hypothetical protein
MCDMKTYHSGDNVNTKWMEREVFTIRMSNGV